MKVLPRRESLAPERDAVTPFTSLCMQTGSLSPPSSRVNHGASAKMQRQQDGGGGDIRLWSESISAGLNQGQPTLSALTPKTLPAA